MSTMEMEQLVASGTRTHSAATAASASSPSDDDSDEELGAWIYRSSLTAKGFAAQKASDMYAESDELPHHTVRMYRERKPSDSGEGSMRPIRMRKRTQFYSPIIKGEEDASGEETDAKMKGIEPEVANSAKVKKVVLGDVGYEFRKEFHAGWFTGTVTEIRTLAGECLISLMHLKLSSHDSSD